MKFSLSWLRTHLQTDAPLDKITDTLSAIGLEVEGVENRGAALAPFRTARIIEAQKHPNADRLRACRVDAGTGEDISVVCGAPNARTGLHVVFAPPGAFIPGTGITLKAGEIRGVLSAGMLVSSRELALGEDHEGILELPEGTQVGLPYAAWAGLDDPVIEIGVTPNRGDALSIRGVARDLAAAGLGRLIPWKADPVPAAFGTPIKWEIAWPEACPFVLGRSIKNVRNGPSPDWLQRRLTAIGLRPINALVDITNFFTFDLGRPLHVFDAGAISGNTLTLRRGDGQEFAALNGKTITPGPDDLVIADDSGPISLAGIMGGASTGTTEATNHVFVECALFDPVHIALTGRRLALHSDARQRFERGIDQALPQAALEAATRMILDLCGGEPGTVVSAGAEPAWQRQASLRFARIAALGGSAMGADQAVSILENLGFAPIARDEARITVSVPPWRNDVAGAGSLDQFAALDPARGAAAQAGAAEIEPECDLLEEVLRIGGLDGIAPVSLPLQGVVPSATLSPRQARAALARRVLAASGLAECVTYSFASRAEVAAFGEVPEALVLKNPIAADLDVMRPTPLVTLAQAARRNLARGAGAVSIFEVGPGFSASGQALMAAGVRLGAPPRHWQKAATLPDAMAAKSDAMALLGALGVPLQSLSVTREAPGYYHPGRSGALRQGPKVVTGYFGELHPALLEQLGLPGPAAAFEILLDSLPDAKRRRRAPPDLPSLQPVARDFAFVVEKSVEAETVLRAVRSAVRDLISSVGIFDVYEGDNLPSGEKSVGVEVVFQPRERTLTDKDLESACAKVVDAVVKTTAARLR